MWHVRLLSEHSYWHPWYGGAIVMAESMEEAVEIHRQFLLSQEDGEIVWGDYEHVATYVDFKNGIYQIPN